jgi:hypothetical protein
VVKPAARQVNDTSDLLLDIEYQRSNRKVAAVRFRVSDNPQMLLFAQRQAALAAALEEEKTETPPVADPVEAGSESESGERLERLREKLRVLGLNARQIRTALASHDAAYLEGNIAVVERDLAVGKVQNLPAYLLAALRNDYRPATAQAPPAVVNAPDLPIVVEPPSELPEARMERLRLQFQAERLQAALDRLTLDERQALEQDYVMHLEQSQGFEMRLILGRYRKNGLSSRMVESHFRIFARTRLVAELDEVEFAAYASWHSAGLE